MITIVHARINQCVGLHNERHFVMFLLYLMISTYCLSIAGWHHVLAALGWYDVCFAVTIMTAWHIYGIACGETSVESQDNEHYRKVAKRRGEEFVNSYDLGKLKNLELYFNVGKDGYPLWTLLFPFRVSPYTDGRSWARPKGLERHKGVRKGEELTDEDEED
ncbi:hypothetical protein EUX98_g2690 [Antrodiella citrinella]|uniref:Uncharacterized protein n=1 Tax=Antrodiella citrinella TaxID=2447956 RepID=A0A4S4MYD3_9APHY|nr:hypothetical protein EUX98_g2690 [Antrodiella citrinella]